MSKKNLNPESIVNELREGSVFFQPSEAVTPPSREPAKKRSTAPEKKSSEVTELRTSEVENLLTSVVRELRSYELRSFDELRRLDIRVTGEQKRFLDEMEETITQAMPEGERGNPDHRRITKNSIMRVFVEIFRQLRLKVDASRFRNERDLLEALFEELLDRVTELRTSEVRD